jgi:nucleotide-binding universal stress UspA family protein
VEDRPATSPDDRKAVEERLRTTQGSDVKVRVEHRLEHGISDNEILRVAKESKCDLIVMGTHGNMGVGRTVLPGRWVGSVAGKVLHGATCPAVAVKVPETASDLRERPG